MSKVIDELKVSNLHFQANQIKDHLGAWKIVTSEKWVLDTVLGAKIELEDISDLPIHVNSKQSRKNMSDIEKCLFRKEIARLRDRGVIRPIKNLEGGFMPSVFVREKKDKQHRLILKMPMKRKF